MKIIGVAGTDGSGKDTVGELLSERGWLFVSVTDILRDEAKRRALKLTRANLRKVSTEWRREQGVAVLVDKAIDKFKQAGGDYKGLVMASLRNPGEADRIHELGGQMVWVDANQKIRYNRVVKRWKSTEDEVTFEEFQAEEAAQMHSSDPNKLSLSDVKAKCDVFLENNGSDLEAFKAEVLKQLQI